MDGRLKRGNERREALIVAATELFHQKSYQDVSTQEIARAAKMKQGHLTYYFHSKRALGLAVLHKWKSKMANGLAEVGKLKTAKARLLAYIEVYGSSQESFLRWGCPIGSLTDELLRESTDVNHAEVPLIYEMELAWFAQQFEDMGLPPNLAKNEAQRMLCVLQGAIHVGHVLGKPEIFNQLITTQIKHLERVGGTK